MKRGFTLVELSVNLTVAAVILPLIYALARGVEDRVTIGLWHLETADGVQTVAESLRADARTGRLAPGEEPRFLRDGCAVVYRVDEEQVLLREGCGTTEGMARFVASVARVEGGVELHFARPLRPGHIERSVVFVPVEER